MATHYVQEFFWTPTELVQWLRSRWRQSGLWVVLWPIGASARSIDPGDIRAQMFEGVQDEAFQIFIGAPEISPGPSWRNEDGKQLLDFSDSYAVQLVPSVVTRDRKTILLGRLAILRPEQYDDRPRAEQLAAFFRLLQSEMRKASDREHCVVQRLPNGDRKKWKDMLVGREVRNSTMQLKQFAKGEVTFSVEAA